MVDNTGGHQPPQHNPNQPDHERVAEVTGIPRVRLLVGHVDADTAYVVEDYPYGRVLRCRIRYWIDTDTRRGHAGWQRFVSQTTNPRRPGSPWNHPKQSTYAPRMWMYLDEAGHVQHTGISQSGIDPHRDAWLRLAGIYDQLPESDRIAYDELLALSKSYPDRWNRWEDTVGFLADHLREHRNEPPEISNGVITRDGQPYYIGDEAYPVAVTVARLRLAGVPLPGTAAKEADRAELPAMVDDTTTRRDRS
jgi:hypothetical protein